jgi:hypothetical protein
VVSVNFLIAREKGRLGCGELSGTVDDSQPLPTLGISNQLWLSLTVSNQHQTKSVDGGRKSRQSTKAAPAAMGLVSESAFVETAAGQSPKGLLPHDCEAVAHTKPRRRFATPTLRPPSSVEGRGERAIRCECGRRVGQRSLTPELIGMGAGGLRYASADSYRMHSSCPVPVRRRRAPPAHPRAGLGRSSPPTLARAAGRP